MAQIDVSKLSLTELEEIQNDVLKNLAIRQRDEASQPVPIGPHDKHTSSHSKNSIEDFPDFEPEVLKLANQARGIKGQDAGPGGG